jgi:hypothetical protein
LNFSPTSGFTPSSISLSVDKSTLPRGWTTGTVTINSAAGSTTITVRVYVGEVWRAYTPAILR